MARRKRFSFFAAGTAAIIGVALYLPAAGVPFINGVPVGHGYAGANCPVGLWFDASPTFLVYGGATEFFGQLVPETGANVASQSINISRINAGTSTAVHTLTATTD